MNTVIVGPIMISQIKLTLKSNLMGYVSRGCHAGLQLIRISRVQEPDQSFHPFVLHYRGQ